MPIFLAFFETLRRLPYTTANWINSIDPSGIKIGEEIITAQDLMFDFSFLNPKVFGIDLFKTIGEGDTWQKIGIWVLGILVAGTQLLMQYFNQRRAKKQKDDLNKDIPVYRQPQQTEQQKSMNMTMNIMMYSMPVMMLIFIIQSPAGLGWYWLVGNIYTAIQSAISAKTSAKKIEKLREKFSR